MSGPPEPADALALDENAALAVLQRGLRREVERVGFGKVILGLSGGLDSALVAFLAVRIFGPDRVLLLCMPHSSSSPDSLAHGRLVAQALGVPPIVEDISPQIDAYFAARTAASPQRRGNKMARERMTILYDYSMARGALVLGTSNKTELLLGYTTLYGDSACAIMPIGDLYKTQVRRLARFLGVPREVLEKAPSADLWEGQTDEGELGFRYDEVDLLLHHYVDRRQRPQRLLEAGFDAELVDRVLRMVCRSQFKRKLPVVLKLSNRTVDKDFLYPRDWTG